MQLLKITLSGCSVPLHKDELKYSFENRKSIKECTIQGFCYQPKFKPNSIFLHILIYTLGISQKISRGLITKLTQILAPVDTLQHLGAKHSLHHPTRPQSDLPPRGHHFLKYACNLPSVMFH